MNIHSNQEISTAPTVGCIRQIIAIQVIVVRAKYHHNYFVDNARTRFVGFPTWHSFSTSAKNKKRGLAPALNAFDPRPGNPGSNLAIQSSVTPFRLSRRKWTCLSTMEKKTQAGSKIAEIARRVVALLEPLSSEDRHKVINGSLTLLGETSRDGASSGGDSGVHGQDTGIRGKGDHNVEGISPKAQTWLRQNGLT